MGYSHLFQTLASRHTSITLFFYLSFTVFCGPYYSVDLLTMNENEDYKTSPAFLSSFSLVLHAPKAIVSILRTSLTSLVC